MKHTLKSVSALAATLVTIGSLAATVHGAVIVENSTLNDSLGGAGYWAQSFTTDANAWNSISFSWLAQDGVTELAAGNIFLLAQEYLGSPSGLSSATGGFLAESTGVNSGQYEFSPFVTLNAHTQYWAYMGDTSTVDGGGINSSSNYAGGVYYQPDFFALSTSNYTDFGGGFDAGFRISGTVVPEPSSALLLGLGALGVVTRRRIK